ncbi:hypothetical protein EYY60_09945 [Flavobacterium zhairuonense]|uniref:hypothetical protein n=1 Tax=Flavobacterium zhairuonense TaxID=2493631 RepID=UPI0010487420|nr:hypothetical protein [Flavobacterium zhairuonense]KAF2510821.1 hypothetical protein EYY60_09945 [Flavobacterium zhairuonense]
MKLELSVWTHHLNHIIYAYFYFCKEEKIKVDIIWNKNVKHTGAILYVNQKTAFFDYQDDPDFIDVPEKYDCYFKRSLRAGDRNKNVYPLNFNVPMTYKAYWLLMNLKSDFLLNRSNRTEVTRALDKFALFTNSSHSVLDIRRYPIKTNDNGGKIIFHTRLWNPDNNENKEEKERRRYQNEFRINACRLLKKTYKNASAGLLADNLSRVLAPDLLLDPKHSDKKNYLQTLHNYDICIADDGLKNTPGWKIGEYLLYGKAVVTTPLNVEIDDFNEYTNYEKLSTRNSYLELPEKIDNLLEEKKYLVMGENNLLWSDIYLHPKNYIKRILLVIENNS